MIELSIRFTSDAKDDTAPIQVELVRPDTGTRTDLMPFEPPLDDAVLADLQWYLEVFSQWPTGPDYERAARIEAQMEDWGRALLASVTPDRESAQVWRQFADAPADGKLITLDATDPRVLRLPWELLADEGGHLFAAGIGVRRRLKKVAGTTVAPFDLPVRVLVVVARPDDAPFIDPRADAQPLLDALDALGDRAVTEFLYPPTLKALTARLRDRHAPPVHVVHFDGHGVYDAEMGLGFLLFEKDDHTGDRVDANRLGTLLNRCGVPLMVLSACQSAAQADANPYASVAPRLIRAGVGSVLAMNYSVLIAATRKFVEAFYGALTAGLSIGQAVDEGRYALLADETRHTLTRRNAAGDLVEETVTLRDWFLPALYQQAKDPVVFAPSPENRPRGRGLGALGSEGPTALPQALAPSQATARKSSEPPYPNGQAAHSAGAATAAATAVPQALTDPTVPGGLPAPPHHGFHGRAREMLALARTLAERRAIVLHGFGGMGKTALAAEAGRWFHRTGRFPGGAAFVSFEYGGSLDQLCAWVAQAVSGDEDYLLHADDPIAAVGELLRARPALIILDNFESVVGPDPLMPPDELEAVLDAVWRWVSSSPPVGERSGEGASRLLITTRDPTLTDPRFRPSRDCAHVELGGLATPDALDLAAAVLDDHGIDRAGIPRQALVDLMRHLGGHPLSLTLVLPHLRDYAPGELTARFEDLLPGFTEGEAAARNESLAVSLQFSLDRLGEATRAALPDLAVFQGGALESELLAITGMDEDLWQAARAEMEAAALITAEPVPGVIPPFLRFHPTLAPYLAGHLDDARRAELEAAYWQRYYAVANYLYREDTPHPHQARAVARREMPNLRRALDLALDAGAAAEAVTFADRIAKFLDNFGRWREREGMMKAVERRMSEVESQKADNGEDQGVTKTEFLLRSRQGEALWQRGQAAEAEGVFRDLLGRLEREAAYDAGYDRAMTLAWLGRCLAAQGQPTQAVAYHERALAGFERLSESNASAKEMLGKVYTDLGDNLRAVGRFDEAQEAYENGLEISREVDDHRTVGVILGQLGTLAMLRGDLDEARERYTEALATFQALSEPQMEAVAWHQLGMLAQEAEAWDEAARCYREAVRIREQIRDLPELAKSFNQLAIVAEGAGRPDDAERWYLRAQELKDQIAPNDASTLNNLANLYRVQGRLDEAETYAHRALTIDEAIDDPSTEIWKDYSILAQIAEARGRAEEAARWHRKANESRDAYAGTQHQIRPILEQFQPVINGVVAACEGDEQAKAQVEELFETFQQGNWQIVEAIQRIWAGERDADALTAHIDYNSRAIVLEILRQLSGDTPIPSTAEPSPSPAEGAGSQAHALARLREQWMPVVDAVAAAARAGAPAPDDLDAFLDEIGGTDDWRALVGVLRRIMDGARDPDALLDGLDATDTVIAGAVLRGLGVETGTPPLRAGGAAQDGMSLDDLLQAVAAVCMGQAPDGLGAQLHALTHQLSRDPAQRDAVRALGRVLNRVLSGERDPDLGDLPPDLADAVRRLLAAVGERTMDD